MAERVVAALGDLPVVVVSSAPEVVAWSTTQGLAVIDDPGTLDAAAAAGRAWVRSCSLARVVVVHADLPLATSLDIVERHAGPGIALIVPDHRDDGTPLLSVPSDAPFAFAYGPGSAAQHAAEARRCGLDVRIVRDPALGFDVDVEDDLRVLDTWRDRSPS
jgi:2-phospho-L-lactate guanylyltransferase